MARVVSIIIGYIFGMIQTGYIYGRINHIDIRQYGSGNAGTTNVMRTLGKKAGFITYFADAIKALVAALVVHLVFGQEYYNIEALLFCYCGLGVVLGHNYPFYLKFKGGKGIAASSGVIVSFLPFNWLLTVMGFITFMGTMFYTKYVSLASLTMMLAFCFEFMIVGKFGSFNLLPAEQFEADVIIIIITALAFIRHKANIVRLYNGNERMIGQSKKQ